MPGMKVFMQNPPTIRIGGQVSKSPYQYSMQSPNRQLLYTAARNLEKALRAEPGMVDLTSDLEVTSPEVDVTIDGTLTPFTDSGQVLNTGGVDAADCSPAPGPNDESIQWTKIGSAPCAGASLRGYAASHARLRVRAPAAARPGQHRLPPDHDRRR